MPMHALIVTGASYMTWLSSEPHSHEIVLFFVFTTLWSVAVGARVWLDLSQSLTQRAVPRSSGSRYVT